MNKNKASSEVENKSTEIHQYILSKNLAENSTNSEKVDFLNFKKNEENLKDSLNISDQSLNYNFSNTSNQISSSKPLNFFQGNSLIGSEKVEKNQNFSSNNFYENQKNDSDKPTSKDIDLLIDPLPTKSNNQDTDQFLSLSTEFPKSSSNAGSKDRQENNLEDLFSNSISNRMIELNFDRNSDVVDVTEQIKSQSGTSVERSLNEDRFVVEINTEEQEDTDNISLSVTQQNILRFPNLYLLFWLLQLFISI